MSTSKSQQQKAKDLFVAYGGFCGYKLQEVMTRHIIKLKVMVKTINGEDLPSGVKCRLPRVKKSSDADVRRPEGLDVTAQHEDEHQLQTITRSLLLEKIV